MMNNKTIGGVVKFLVRSTTISASFTFQNYIGQLKQKPPESCQKDAKKFNIYQELYKLATAGLGSRGVGGGGGGDGEGW